MELHNEILKYKQEGLSYSELSAMFKLPLGTVKSLYSRALQKYEQQGVCKACGVAISYTKGKKRKIFCSDACRLQWWNHNRHLLASKATITKQCAHCGEVFRSQNYRHRKYCSHHCYVAARYQSDK